MSARARNFLAANDRSPVVYGSVDDAGVTYRLADGKVFRLNTREARQAPHPRWAFAEAEMNSRALKAASREERELLANLIEEAGQ